MDKITLDVRDENGHPGPTIEFDCPDGANVALMTVRVGQQAVTVAFDYHDAAKLAAAAGVYMTLHG